MSVGCACIGQLLDMREGEDDDRASAISSLHEGRTMPACVTSLFSSHSVDVLTAPPLHYLRCLAPNTLPCKALPN